MQSNKPSVTTFDLLNHLSTMIQDAELHEHNMYSEFTGGHGDDPQMAMLKYIQARAKTEALSDAWSELSRRNTCGNS